MTTETHTYADGSQRVGCAPFPKLSPLEEQADALRGTPYAVDVVTVDTAKPKVKPGPKPKAKDAD